MNVPIKPGTARRLGLRNPVRSTNLRHYRQRWIPIKFDSGVSTETAFMNFKHWQAAVTRGAQ